MYCRSTHVKTLDGMSRAASPIVRRRFHFAWEYSVHSTLWIAWAYSSCDGQPTSPWKMSKRGE